PDRVGAAASAGASPDAGDAGDAGGSGASVASGASGGSGGSGGSGDSGASVGAGGGADGSTGCAPATLTLAITAAPMAAHLARTSLTRAEPTENPHTCRSPGPPCRGETALPVSAVW